MHRKMQREQWDAKLENQINGRVNDLEQYNEWYEKKWIYKPKILPK